MELTPRRQKITNLLMELGLDALIFFQSENIRYLCNFTGSDGALIVTPDQFVFLTDSRYTTQAKEEVIADSICEYTVKSDGVISQLLKTGVTCIGFEAELSFGFATELQGKGLASWRWRHYKEELQALRLHKSAEEVRLIGDAAFLHVAALSEVEEIIKPGTSEKQLALAIEMALRKLGAEEKAFDIIVASGVRGALPHGIASDKILNEGELVTVDFGCRLEGYHSDETVTMAIGAVSRELRAIFDIVLEAHDRALEAIVPGLPLSELDRVARNHIQSGGYGEYFGHGLGHGVGLQIHEAPTISPRSKATAEVGMVFTVEPGIYVPGVGGVRIEDMVLVTAEGHEVLTKLPKTFRNILLN
jgi:Xaa-Pro aminopeptidase